MYFQSAYPKYSSNNTQRNQVPFDIEPVDDGRSKLGDDNDWKFFSTNNIYENARQEIAKFTYLEKGEIEQGEVGNGESIISLLIKLHSKLKGGVLKYRFGQQVSAVPKLENLIEGLLNQMGGANVECKSCITDLINELKPTEEDSIADQRAEMKRKAKEHRQKLLEKLKGQQDSFKTQNEKEFNNISQLDDDDDRPLCCVCRLPGDDLGNAQQHYIFG